MTVTYLTERLFFFSRYATPHALHFRTLPYPTRRSSHHIVLAATTLSLAPVAALSPLMRSPAPDASRTAQPVVATVPVAPAPTAVDVELRAIDRALQAGYARNATDDEQIGRASCREGGFQSV